MTTISADGAAGGRKAAAILCIAVCAETSFATMDEDSAKVDLKISFRHPFTQSTLITAHCQVKAGASFRYISTNKDVITLKNIDTETINSLSQGTHPAMLLWVPTQPWKKIYWHIFHYKRFEKTPIKIPIMNTITPSLRYDLLKAHEISANSVRPRQHEVSTKGDAMKRARQAYKTLKNRKHIHPLVGEIKITRFAWRHVTRASRTKSRIEASLRVLPHMEEFLNRKPARYLVTAKKTHRSGSKVIETREIIFWYPNAIILQGQQKVLLIRVREEIMYPSNWIDYPLSVSDVSQKATLVSWWCK
jgi:hypothetical protein